MGPEGYRVRQWYAGRGVAVKNGTSCSGIRAHKRSGIWVGTKAEVKPGDIPLAGMQVPSGVG
jgi:hypothetical protein